MALKEFLADGDVFDSDQPAARLVLSNGVHEQRRISITQAIQRLRDVDEHGLSVYQKGWSVLFEGVSKFAVSGSWARTAHRALGPPAENFETPFIMKRGFEGAQ
jgi:hypothetical protein